MPQDPNDEPASLPTLARDELPAEVPPHWCYTSLFLEHVQTLQDGTDQRLRRRLAERS